MKKFTFLLLSALTAISGYAQIPNSDFENWNTASLTIPTDWRTFGTVTQQPGASGLYSIRIERNPANPSEPGAFIHGNPSGMTFWGGMPITSRPDSIVGNFKYSIATNDTAWVLVIFKYQGTPISMDINLVMGSNPSSFTRLAFKNNFTSLQTPDSVVVGVTSTNPNDPSNPMGGYMIVDDLRFTDLLGNSYPILNGNFESWQTLNNEQPNNWFTSNPGYLGWSTLPVTKTTDSYSGTYAMRIENVINTAGFGSGYALAGPQGTNGPAPGFPMTSRDTTFNGYYKFLPQGDTLTFGAVMFYQGNQVGWGFFQNASTVNTYTYFTTDINYDMMFSGVPDSATVFVLPFQGGNNPHGNSVLFVDKLGFNEQTPTAVNTNIANEMRLMVYPNPASTYTNISFYLKETAQTVIAVYDITGKLVETISNKNESAGAHILRYETGDLANGIYTIGIESNGINRYYKLSVER